MILRPTNPLVVHQTGATLTPHARCEHGHPAVFLVLFGDQRSGTARVDAMMPRCAFAELVGQVQAEILRTDGEAALRAFRDAVDAGTRTTTAALDTLRAQRRDCCEAGYRTNGTEHTCGDGR
ncbi:MAG TPA: hypothetical protein VFP69_10810, partial [Streptomyces sp.]|nr:hypothetical protein [Streptomyces sp.]